MRTSNLSEDHGAWLGKFAKYLVSQGKRAATVECYCRDARDFLLFWQEGRQPLMGVDPTAFAAYQNILAHEKKDRSVRRTSIGVRQFFRFLHKEGLFQTSPLETAILPSAQDRPPALISHGQYQELQKACEKESDPLKRERDLVMLALLGWEGLKVGELCDLEWKDFLPGSPATLKIRGDKERCLVLYPPTAERLEIYRHHVETLAPSLWQKNPKMIIAFKGQIKPKPFPKVSRHGIKFTLMEWGFRVNIAGVCAEALRHHAVQFMHQYRDFDEAKVTSYLGLRSQLLASRLCRDA